MRFGVRAGAGLCVVLALAPLARAADKAAIDAAVARAVAYLKTQQQADGTWKPSPGTGREVGATSLCGIALLEADVPAEDPAVQKAARAVRQQSISCTYTYSLSLAIMFLDRLGDRADAELIESLAIRLIAGQDPLSGGWSYQCPGLSPDEVRRLQAQLQQRPEPAAEDPPKAPKGFRDLPREIQQQMQQVAQQQQAGGAGGVGSGDNSNTQFATLALWIARRQGIPVEGPMRRLDTRFRASQRADGGWGYLMPNLAGPPLVAMPNMPGMQGGMNAAGSTPAMTCAGLLALAVSRGSAHEATLRANLPGTNPAPSRRAVDFGKDPIILRGIAALGSSLTLPFEAQPNGGQPATAPQLNYGKGYYFLFSLERVAMVYGLDTFGGKDWYEYGSSILLHSQAGDGSWAGEFAAGGSDTCFGILFLRRANLAQDLSATLRGKVSDVNLQAGGVGGQALLLKGVGLKPAVGGKEDSSAAPPGGPRPSGSGAGGSRPNPPTIGGNTNDTPPAAGNPTEPRPSAAPKVDAATAHLGDELVNATAAEQDDVLTRLRDTKGPEYTDALAYAIHKLSGPAKAKARDALADRLTRMSAKTLTSKLEDDNFEVRRAAALAVAMKPEKALVPRLIELLEDPEAPVGRAAHAALKSLTGQDFGPDAEASRADLGKSVAAWKDWWSKNGGN